MNKNIQKFPQKTTLIMNFMILNIR